jgi:hypothetical protein
VLADLTLCLKDKKFEETLPWHHDEPKAKVYCRGIATNTDTGDSLLIIYRAVGDHSGSIHGVKVGADVGPEAEGTVLAGSESGGERIIWGQPCYYWFIPEKNLLASIQFPHSSSDIEKLTSYLKAHINLNGNFGIRVKKTQEYFNPKTGKNVRINKTTFPYGEGKEQCNCIFKFSAKELVLKTVVSQLEELSSQITQTVIRDTTTVRTPDDRGPLLQIGSEYLPSLFGAEPDTSQALKVELVIDGAPSAEDIVSLFTDESENSDWRDIGFKINGSSSTTWLKKYVARTKIFVDSDGESHLSPEMLLKSITKARDDLLSGVKRPESIAIIEDIVEAVSTEAIADTAIAATIE